MPTKLKFYYQNSKILYFIMRIIKDKYMLQVIFQSLFDNIIL